VLLGDSRRESLSIRVVGYQFPEAEDPRQRFSWHMVEGEAQCPEGRWTFRYAALTCDESPLVSAWLREAGAAFETRGSHPVPLTFTEPNLSFRVGRFRSDGLDLEVGLDLEFQPPWHRSRYAGDPFPLSLPTSAHQLRTAAAEWDAERAPFPDGLTPSGT
jgi:hypothetical protein